MWQRLAVPGALALLVAAEAGAQELPTVIQSLRPAQVIRVRTVTRGIHVGRLIRAGADSLYLTPIEGSPSVALDAIDALWVRGTAAKTGAIIGGIGAGVLTGAFFVWIVDALCETENCETVEAGIVGALVGGAAGALTGAVLGTFVDKWHRRYP